MDDRVAVIVVNWNETALTLECLRSVVASVPEDTAIILVDNGSDVDPCSAIRQALPQVYVVRLSSNGGYAVGCNAGAHAALDLGATHLFFLNNDATIEPSTVPVLLEAARRRPRAIFGPKIVYADEPDRVWSAGGTVRRPWMENQHLDRGAPSESVTGARRVDWTTGCAFFVLAGTFRLIGPLSEEYFLYLEDLDWCMRARSIGIETWCVPDAIVRHRVSSSTSRLPRADVLYYGCRNTYRLAFKHSSPRARLAMWMVVLVALAKVITRNMLSPAHRRDPLYRARTLAIVDFILRREGPRRAPPVTPLPASPIG